MALAGAVFAFTWAITPAASAQTSVGTIYACYYSPECSYSKTTSLTPPVDGPAFQFNNTGSQAITAAKFAIAANKKLNIAADHYVLGTIKPGASKVIIVGASSDKKTHTAGAFFYYSGPSSPTDTSDNGVDVDNIVFKFTGKIGTTVVTSGNIVTGATAGPSVDGTVAKLNFLGGPGNADGPCNDCFGSRQIATLSAAAAVTVR